MVLVQKELLIFHNFIYLSLDPETQESLSPPKNVEQVT